MATSNSANLVTEIAAAPVSFRRRAMNALVTGAAAGAVLLVKPAAAWLTPSRALPTFF